MATESAAGQEAQEIVEFPLLLTVRQAEALSHASCDHGMTAGQLARRAINEFLARAFSARGGRSPRPERMAPS
jgi:hypothetical protein